VRVATRRRLALVGIGLSLAVTLISALTLIGRPVRIVDILLMYFSGVMGGAGLVGYLRRRTG
jgi:hypothetical protein